ncbi:ABC transporter substrate-binding protein [Hydrogenovibrio marinus]|uniref:ABC transporter substrate-binding protein n=1 Tax=Hydrogenovibrio marinus TaxID=28885 RepID=A0A066ZSK5_HYDMR|nr:ABC transporter substrate-binding protein [Hydrogenovibrio marinus]KDN95234.1 ABC transporter substrate-binding protein [Hydrogenovibrio marinus]BBN59711.1 ABC transporter substrate-binding protein [Hydrogenovibrio marinus]
MDRRTFFKRTSSGLAGLAVWPSISLLAGCETHSSASQILVGVTSRTRVLDPRQATDALSSRLNRLIYRQLIDFNESFEPIPDLATWEMVSPTQYRFTLKVRPRFHHGKQLSSEDVVATFDSILDPKQGSPLRGSLKHITSAVALNDTQFDFHLAHPDTLFVGRLVIGILPKDLIEQDHSFLSSPIGCGACRFLSMDEQRLVLQRPDKTTLEFIPVKDATVRVLKLRKGELDLIQNDLSPELLNYCHHRDDLVVSSHFGTSFAYIGFNFEDPLLSKLEMRQALAHGINRPLIIDTLFAGEARLAGGLLVPEHWCGVPDLKGFDYDPDKARALLSELRKQTDLIKPYLNEAGEIQLSYKTSSDPTRIRLATIYQAELKKIGIALDIQSYDWGTFYSDIKKGRFQLYSLAWVGIKSPDIFQYVFDSDAIPPRGANRGRYRDAEADTLIREAGEAQSLAEEAKLYRQLQRHLQDTLAAMPLWYENQYAVMRKGVEGYQLYSDGRFDGLLKVKKMV